MKYGWFSNRAYKVQGGSFYLDKDKNIVICTIISNTEICPYDEKSMYKEDCKYLGKVKKYKQIIYSVEV